MIEFEIILGKGFKELSFGDKENDIIKVFGKPNNIDTYDYPDNTDSKTLQYGDLDISFTLNSEENYRLTYFSIYSKDFHIRNEIRIGIEKKRLLKLAEKLNFGNYKIEDSSTIEDPTHELISFDKINTNFWFDYDKLSSMQVGPLWKDENTIKWPE